MRAETYRDFLKRELETRRLKNPSYSLRAFAKFIGMPAPKLSQVMRGLCGISLKTAEAIAKKLHFEGTDLEYFLTMVEMEHSRKEMNRAIAAMKVRHLQQESYDEISLEKFRMISEWHFFALLELTELVGFRSESPWIAKRLGITTKQAKEAVNLLLDHGLLKWDSSGKRLVQTHADLATPSGVPSQHIKAYHTKMLSKAIDSLEKDSVTERDFAATTLSIDASRLDEAQKALREFRRKFCADLQQSKNRNRVYCLSMQLFPVSEISET